MEEQGRWHGWHGLSRMNCESKESSESKESNEFQLTGRLTMKAMGTINQKRNEKMIQKMSRKFRGRMGVQLLVMLLSGLLMPTAPAAAADGSSGCGPGWYILKDNSLVSSAFRATTNGLLFPVYTIGMTVGTSNCTKHSIVLNEKKSLHLITMSFFEIRADIARGEGPHLRSLSTTLGCSEQATQPLGRALKDNYPALYAGSDADPEVTLTEVYKTIFSDSNLTQQCSLKTT